MTELQAGAAPRTSGLLLPLFSLPGPWGCGDLGFEAVEFARRVRGAGQGFWQVLPPMVTSGASGQSPYSALSSFALDPLYLSPERLVRDGWIDGSWPVEVAGGGGVAAGDARRERLRLVRLAAERDPGRIRARVEKMRSGVPWAGDFALFRAIKHREAGRPWTEWPEDLRDRRPEALERVGRELADAVDFELFVQAVLEEQWTAFRGELKDLGLDLWGDLPFYVAHDSADVWLHPELFDLDETGRPNALSGCPPDEMAEEGQLWGQPVHRWPAMEADGFAWWLARVERQLELFDRVRIDHFRGLAATWQVPAGEETAAHGEWVPSPSDRLVDLLRDLRRDPRPGSPFVAEDLGVITEDVRELRRRLGAPGTRVVQFAFADDPNAEEHWPESCPENNVLATGTHDTAPLLSWLANANENDTRALRERLDMESLDRAAAEELIRRVLASPARWTLLPVQDVLGLGAESRVNRPGEPTGQWRWRLQTGDRLDAALEKLAAWTAEAGRSA